MPELDASLLILAGVAIALGGLIKGATGIGLPIVAVGIMANFLPVTLTLALVTFPIVLSNLFQAARSGGMMAPLRRFWPMIMVLLPSLWLSARLVVALDPRVLYGLIGTAVVLFTLTTYLRPPATLSPRAELWLGPVAGLAGGFLGGLSTIWGPPMIMYFVMLNLSKEAFIRAVGLVWFSASLLLVVSYVGNGILTTATAPLSLAACVPGLVGLAAGTAIRNRVNPETFRKVFLVTFFFVGLNLFRRAFF